MRIRKIAFAVLLGSTSALSCAAVAQAQAPAVRQTEFNIPAGDLVAGLRAFSRQSHIELIFNAAELRGKRTGGVTGTRSAEDALRRLLNSANAQLIRDPSGAYLIKPAENAPRPVAAPAAYSDEIIVTAQKKEERITDVPIAMSAFSAEVLDDYKIEGGSELLRAVPNVNFSKNNFSMYNFSIRGIGTKAISASSDPAVAISFNNVPLARNRLFEQEFFDVERIEVLRGPQGTLYGRNATAGVVNMITVMPKAEFGGEIKGEVGSFKTRRLGGMLNVPITETLGVRVAGAWTKRDGFDYNTFTQKRVNGRDLWSTRVTAEWKPTDSFSANVIWQRFGEDDNRSRTGKQLCTRDEGPDEFAGIPITDEKVRGRLSQGCKPASNYSDNAYGLANGNSLSYMVAANAFLYHGYKLGTFDLISVTKTLDPFGNKKQSRNLREIETAYDPIFRANNDIIQLNMKYSNDSGLEFHSQTAYSKDNYFSTQDYNRSLSDPAFNDSLDPYTNLFGQLIDSDKFPGMSPNGIICDEIIGICSDRVIGVDLSRSDNRQWYQEFRVQSDFNSNINFNFGVNYLDFKTEDKYYVFNNVFNLLSKYLYGSPKADPDLLPWGATGIKDCPLDSKIECVGVELAPMADLQDVGHNYFLSKNKVRTKSFSVYSEAYVSIRDDLKLTVGARYTHDTKVSSQIPSQLLLGMGGSTGGVTGGRSNWGYAPLDDIRQSWGALTGRVVLDWKPNVDFSDDTLIYLSYARGYKGGGTNPPRVDIDQRVVQYLPLAETFKPEYVNAFEVGTKNSFNGGRLKFNATAFFYDYKDYQISQITDRISFNENFGATSYGLEFETIWKPARSLRFDANLGLLKTRVKKGNESVDVMDRTAGDPDWVVLRPWLQAPSNCIAPRIFVEKIFAKGGANVDYHALSALCAGSTRFGHYNPNYPKTGGFETRYGFTWDPMAPYNPDTIGLNMADGGSGAPNGGRGIGKPLEGNELPNAPRLTFNMGAQYTHELYDSGWIATMRGDYYIQSKSYARIYNTEYDRIKSWNNVNLSITLSNDSYGVDVSLYIKNVFDSTPITDFYTNSDDTGLNTNVFTLDPRIFGFSVSKSF
ncbi:MAG TPA: TonB-dependent receptor [Sphingopyxis sp.]|nr:TonB-dependent receptor [Sphingopyxis sp.]